MPMTREQGERSDKIGHLGEIACDDEFSKNDIVWNRVRRDRAGFDANASWVTDSESVGVPFALPARFFALVQVKTSDDLRKNRPYVTLERALDLIDHHGPSFVVLLDFKAGLQVVECEVLHVAAEFVRAVYERVAKASNTELSQQRITISEAYTRKLGVAELAAYVVATSGPSPAAYEQLKLKENELHRTSARVDAAILETVFPRDHREEELAELALGLRERLELKPVGDVSVHVRGNVGTYSDTTLVLGATKGTAITVEVLDQASARSFKGRAFSTRTMFPWLPDHLDETRLAGTVLDIRIKGATRKLGMTLPIPEQGSSHDIETLASEASVFLAVHEALRGNNRLRLAFVVKERRQEASFQGTGAESLSDETKRTLQDYATAGELVRRFATRPIVSDPGLLLQQTAALQAAALFLFPELARDVHASFQDEAPPPDGSTYAVPMVSRCIVGDTIFVLAGHMRGTLVRDESKPGWQRLGVPSLERCLGFAEKYLRTPAQRTELDRRTAAALESRAQQLEGYVGSHTLGAAFY